MRRTSTTVNNTGTGVTTHNTTPVHHSDRDNHNQQSPITTNQQHNVTPSHTSGPQDNRNQDTTISITYDPDAMLLIPNSTLTTTHGAPKNTKTITINHNESNKRHSNRHSHTNTSTNSENDSNDGIWPFTHVQEHNDSTHNTTNTINTNTLLESSDNPTDPQTPETTQPEEVLKTTDGRTIVVKKQEASNDGLTIGKLMASGAAAITASIITTKLAGTINGLLIVGCSSIIIAILNEVYRRVIAKIKDISGTVVNRTVNHKTNNNDDTNDTDKTEDLPVIIEEVDDTQDSDDNAPARVRLRESIQSQGFWKGLRTWTKTEVGSWSWVTKSMLVVLAVVLLSGGVSYGMAELMHEPDVTIMNVTKHDVKDLSNSEKQEIEDAAVQAVQSQLSSTTLKQEALESRLSALENELNGTTNDTNQSTNPNQQGNKTTSKQNASPGNNNQSTTNGNANATLEQQVKTLQDEVAKLKGESTSTSNNSNNTGNTTGTTQSPSTDEYANVESRLNALEQRLNALEQQSSTSQSPNANTQSQGHTGQ